MKSVLWFVSIMKWIHTLSEFIWAWNVQKAHSQRWYVLITIAPVFNIRTVRIMALVIMFSSNTNQLSKIYFDCFFIFWGLSNCIPIFDNSLILKTGATAAIHLTSTNDKPYIATSQFRSRVVLYTSTAYRNRELNHSCPPVHVRFANWLFYNTHHR